VCGDEFSLRYSDLVAGIYDCMDRIVLNAFFPLGHHPGGFRTWWRRWHGDSDAELDNTHLMRMAGRFARRVKAWGAANAVPVIFGTPGERKHRIAEAYLASVLEDQSEQVASSVFLETVGSRQLCDFPGRNRGAESVDGGDAGVEAVVAGHHFQLACMHRCLQFG
jgi:hypothetical protein